MCQYGRPGKTEMAEGGGPASVNNGGEIKGSRDYVRLGFVHFTSGKCTKKSSCKIGPIYQLAPTRNIDREDSLLRRCTSFALETSGFPFSAFFPPRLNMDMGPIFHVVVARLNSAPLRT